MTAQPPQSGSRRIPRRAVLLGARGLATGAVGAGATLAATSAAAGATLPDRQVRQPPTGEDLMQEHGVLIRILLIYRELIRRFEADGELPAQHLNAAALVVHEFIEGFHEALEEGWVFPRRHRAGQLTETVSTLLTPHAHGRVLTQFILDAATPTGVSGTNAKANRSANTRTQLVEAMRAFDLQPQPSSPRPSPSMVTSPQPFRTSAGTLPRRDMRSPQRLPATCPDSRSGTG